MFVKKIISWLKRKINAQKLGIEFNRVSNFSLPEKLRINGVLSPVNIPEDKGMQGEFIEVLLDDCYQLQTLSKKITKLKPKILDIGANVGLFGISARNTFPEAIVHAYEPNPNLKENLQVQSKAANFQVFMEAVGIEDGKISLNINPDVCAKTRSQMDKSGDIPMIAFRKVVERLGGEIDLAKIDCEGAEWFLFQDSEPWQAIKNLTMEYHLFQKNQTLEKVRENLNNLGFKIVEELPYDKYYGLIHASR